MEDQVVQKKRFPWEVITLIVCLYFFILGVKLFGAGFKAMGTTWAQPLIHGVNNPISGLFIGILATALMQSSSATTSMLVGLVAANQLDLAMAIPVVMGANIGTTATNGLVSIGHITHRGEFRRAAAASSIHDFFNIMVVVMLLPLELMTHFLQKSATVLAQVFAGVWSMEASTSPMNLILKPAVNFVKMIMKPVDAKSHALASFLIILIGGIMIFMALVGLTKNMKRLMMQRVESVFQGRLQAGGYTAMILGLVVTVLVQSSSITTSLMVPLAASGIVTLAQIYPVMMGANIGTTMTAIIAALAGNQAALTLAFTHMLFNITGVLVFFVPPPMRKLPMALATKMGDLSHRHRAVLPVYVIMAFYVLPALVIWLCW